MKIHLDKLIELVNKHTIEVSWNGFEGVYHDVVNVAEFLCEIHEAVDDTPEEFIKFINDGRFTEIPELNDIFTNIQSQGMFMIKGMDKLSGGHYIECKKLTWLNNTK